MADDAEWLTPGDIARRLRVGRATVHAQLLVPGSGLLYHRVGRRWIVGRAAFERWLNGGGDDERALRDMPQAR